MSDRKRPKKSHLIRTPKNHQIRVAERFRFKWPSHRNHLLLRMLIHYDSASTLIGNRGASIKETREKHDQLDICCPDSNTKDRVLQISAIKSEDPEHNIQLLLEFMRDYLERIDAHRKDENGNLTINLLIPEVFAKVFIGQRGDKIVAHRRKCHSIDFFSDEVCPGSTDNIISVCDGNVDNLLDVTEQYLRDFLENPNEDIRLMDGLKSKRIRFYCGNFDTRDTPIAFYGGFEPVSDRANYFRDSGDRDGRDARNDRSRDDRESDYIRNDRKRTYQEEPSPQMAAPPMMMMAAPQMAAPGVTAMAVGPDGFSQAERLAQEMGLGRDQFLRLRRQIIMDML